MEETIIVDDGAEPLTPLAVPSACKICRGQGLDLVYTDTTPYISHIRTVHPESVE